MRIRLETIGCRLNIGEVEALARSFAARGHRVVAAGEPADLCVLNTCTVTGLASRKSRQLIRQVRRAYPDAAVVVTGCYAEMVPDAVRMLGVDLVVGNRAKDDLPDVLDAAGLLTDAEAIPESGAPSTNSLLDPGRRTRAFVKAQDGCDNACTFCIVTVARGEGRSRAPDQVVNEVRELTDLGYREAVLSGVHLGSYGHDLGDRRGLALLIRRLLDETAMPRLRLSSLEPWDLDETFFELFADSRLLPHLHLPLQSGCDATLRRMGRRTSPSQFVSLVSAARRAIPNLAVSTDVMVGFPGETDEEFDRSSELVERLAFSRLHVFRFSPREGTRAATMPDQVPVDVSHSRSRRMHDLGARLEERFHSGLIGRAMPVLWETLEGNGGRRRWSGLTGNNVRVLAWSDPGVDLTNEVVPVTVEHTVPGAVVGRFEVGRSGPVVPLATSRPLEEA